MKTSKQFFALILFIALLNALTVNAQNTFPASGNVGIGTSTPGALLDVNGSTRLKTLNVTSSLSLESGQTVYTNYPGFATINRKFIEFERNYKNDANRGTVKFYAPSNYYQNIPVMNLVGNYGAGGAVGIGTANPKRLLHVAGDIYTKGHIWFHAYEGDGKSGTAYIQGRDFSDTSSIGLQFRSQNEGSIVNALKIMPNGRVGIGTTTPGATLDVNGSVKTKDIYATGKLSLEPTEPIYVNYKSSFATINRKFVEFETDYKGDANRGLTHFYAPTNYYANVPALTLIGNYGAGGTVGIGTSEMPAGYRLAVDGKIICEEVKVQLSENWPDYVFKSDYELMPLNELANYIATEKHLPGIPAAAEIDGKGVEMGEMQRKMMEKIEELTLYMIQQQEQIATQQQQIKDLKAELQK